MEDRGDRPSACYVRPHEAWKRMKEAQSTGQTVYIWGSTGCGKTILVENFLARRTYEYYSVTADGRLELPEKPVGRGRIVVVDDLHRLWRPEERARLLPDLKRLVAAPKVWLILIGRPALPAWLRPLSLQGAFTVLGEDVLCLTEAEESDFWLRHGLKLTDEAVQNARETGGGHPLFLLAAAQELSALETSGDRRVERELAALTRAQAAGADYLDVHVFDQWDVSIREFLMELSVVERFDLDMARLITKNSDAARYLQLAQELGAFLTEAQGAHGTVYAMREPMRWTMQRRLTRTRTRQELDELYYSAASAYELKGDTPAALAMYASCGNQAAITRLLIANARLYAGAGCYWQLRRYYLALPRDIILRNPELMAGMSMLCSIMLRDDESENWYQALADYAQRQTGSARRDAQMRLCYLDIALPHRGITDMPDLLRHMGTLVTQWKLLLPELSLTNNQPTLMYGGKDFCAWSKRDRELAQSLGKVTELVLGHFGKGLVNLALAESAFERGEDDYTVSARVSKGRFQAESGGKPELVFVAAGLEAQLAALHNQLEDGLEMLDSFRRGVAADAPWLLDEIDALYVRLQLYGGWLAPLRTWMDRAPDEEREFCSLERYRYSVKVRVYLALGKPERAMRLALRLLAYAQQRKRTFLEMEMTLMLAVIKFRLGDGAWQETLQQAVDQAGEYRFVRVFSREGAAVWELFRAANLSWPDESYGKQVLRETRQMAELYPAYLRKSPEGVVQLSEKAQKVLRMQAEGMSVDQIAQALHLSRAGVKYYNQETYKKLGVSGKAAAITQARNRGLL